MRISRQRRPRPAASKEPLFDCIVDNDLQHIPPWVVKLGDRITLSDSCMLEVKTADEEAAFRAQAAQRGIYAANLMAIEMFAGRPRVAWPAPYAENVAGILPDGNRVIL